MSFGDDLWMEGFVSLSARSGGRIEAGSSCEFRSFARLEADVGHIVMGNRCSVNPFSLLNGYGGLRIGNDVRVASHCVILSSSHRYEDAAIAVQAQGVSARPTQIEDDVWIGAHAVIVGGVCVGAHSIIGAGAVVVTDIPPYSIAAGVPARVIRVRNS